MAQFSTIHTFYGLQRMAAAQAVGISINLTHMAIGDGDGNPTLPDYEQTQLVREKFRGPINRVFQDPENPLLFTAELIIPAKIGGFTMHEIGIFDAEGALFAVGNLPATYKPIEEEGAYSDAAVRINFLVSSASVVSIQVDPNVVVVTRTWIQNNVTAAVLIPGGTTNQVLAKESNANGKFKWMDLGNVNVTVDCIEEPQTLAEGQTIVDLAFTTTRGLAVYIDGHRLAKGTGEKGWTVADAGESDTKIILGKSYPDGTMIVLTQNEPSGSASAPLEIDQNLADLEDVAIARSNLGVYSKSEVNKMVIQPGAVMHYAGSAAPTGWMKANGAAISRTAYALLFSVIGETYGKGDGFNTFNLPDLRGEFIRGLDDGRGVDPSRGLGSAQASQNLAHSHGGRTSSGGSHSHDYVDGRPMHPPGNPGLSNGNVFKGIWENSELRTTQSAGAHSHSLTTDESGGTEARPRNIALLACIKF